MAGAQGFLLPSCPTACSPPCCCPTVATCSAPQAELQPGPAEHQWLPPSSRCPKGSVCGGKPGLLPPQMSSSLVAQLQGCSWLASMLAAASLELFPCPQGAFGHGGISLGFVAQQDHARGAPGFPPPGSSSPQPFPRHDGLGCNDSCAQEAVVCVCVWWGSRGDLTPPRLLPWSHGCHLQGCSTAPCSSWDGSGVPHYSPYSCRQRPLARCNVAGRPTALVTAAATSASWHQSSCAALLATLIYLSSLINELNKPTSLLAVPLVLQGLPAPNTRGGHET